MAEVTSPRGEREREQRVTADMLDKARARWLLACIARARPSASVPAPAATPRDGRQSRCMSASYDGRYLAHALRPGARCAA